MPQINYFNRDFAKIRVDLMDWAKQYHPDKFTYFNDASPDMMYLEMVAYVGDILNFYIDKSFNESFRTTAQAKESLVRIASDLGFHEFGSKTSETNVNFDITVPYVVEQGVVTPNPTLLVALQSGTTVISNNGQTFEILEEINFADSRNRTIIPNLDSNGRVINFIVRKSVKAKAGITQIQRFYVTPELAKPFLSITLDDIDITEIVSVVEISGNVYSAPANTVFSDPTYRYYQVKWLGENKMFVEVDPNTFSDPIEREAVIASAVKRGVEVEIPQRFIVRRDINNLVTLTFGNSVANYTSLTTPIETSTTSGLSMNQVLNNDSLGNIPKPNSTLFIKYRVGGGTKTNVEANQISTITSKQFFAPVGTPNPTLLQQVRRSLVVSNPSPAIGGRNELSDEELRNYSSSQFSSQERIVTASDLKTLISTMPPQFGTPFRVSVEQIKPSIAIFSDLKRGVSILLDQLMQSSTNVQRSLKRQEIDQFMNSFENRDVIIPNTTTVDNLISQSEVLTIDIQRQTANILSTVPTLWLGEKEYVHIVGISETGQLTTTTQDGNGVWISNNQVLKENIKNFLMGKRVMGDWIEIIDGRVCNIQIEFTVMTDPNRKQAVLTECLNKLAEYFSTYNWDFNQHIYISNVITILQEINGVLNVVELKFYNVFGIDSNGSGRVYQPKEVGRYRNNYPTALNLTQSKFEMKPVNNIIQSYPDTIFEVKYPDVDLLGKAL